MSQAPSIVSLDPPLPSPSRVSQQLPFEDRNERRLAQGQLIPRIENKSNRSITSLSIRDQLRGDLTAEIRLPPSSLQTFKLRYIYIYIRVRARTQILGKFLPRTDKKRLTTGRAAFIRLRRHAAIFEERGIYPSFGDFFLPSSAKSFLSIISCAKKESRGEKGRSRRGGKRAKFV